MGNYMTLQPPNLGKNLIVDTAPAVRCAPSASPTPSTPHRARYLGRHDRSVNGGLPYNGALRSPPGVACSKPPGRNTSNSPVPTRNWPGAPPELLPDVVGDPAGLSGLEEHGGPSC